MSTTSPDTTQASTPTAAPELPDLRPQLAQAQQWVAGLVARVRQDQLDHPTPCSEFTVRQLLEHLLAVENRIATVGRTGSIGDSPSSAPLPDGDLGEGFRVAVDQATDAWTDDQSLARECTLPWGRSPGAVAVAAYVGENVVHGWDLATAIGAPAEADPQLVAIARAGYERILPPEPRGGEVPFGPVVEPAADAGPTERLANYLGRTSR